MHCLCKSISTSSSSLIVSPITRRTVELRKCFSSCGGPSILYTASSSCKYGDYPFCSADISSSHARVRFDSLFTFKGSAAAHHSFIAVRGFRGAPKRNALGNRSPSAPSSSNVTRSSPNVKKGRVNACKDPPAQARGLSKTEQTQKSNFSKPLKAETRKAVKPLQAQNRRSSKVRQGKPESGARSKSYSLPVEAKPKSTSKWTEAKPKSTSKRTEAKPKSTSKRTVIVDELESFDEDDEFEEALDDDGESSDDIDDEDIVDEDEDFDDEDEEFDDEEDEVSDDELVKYEDVDKDELVDGDDEFFIDDMLDEEGEDTGDVVLGDGGDGGGVNISHTEWGGRALTIAKGVLAEFGDNFSLYAFKSSFENRIYVRLDKHSDKYGSPSMAEIESFANIFGKRLEEAGEVGTVPDNIDLEVSSPGAERVVHVPDQLLRFKSLPMFVRYEEVSEGEAVKSSPVVKDGILELVSVETEAGRSVWKLANVRANREQAGKGRGLTKKQKEWRAELPLSVLRLVRLYMDV